MAVPVRVQLLERRLEARRHQQILEVRLAAVDEEVDHLLVGADGVDDLLLLERAGVVLVDHAEDLARRRQEVEAELEEQEMGLIDDAETEAGRGMEGVEAELEMGVKCDEAVIKEQNLEGEEYWPAIRPLALSEPSTSQRPSRRPWGGSALHLEEATEMGDGTDLLRPLNRTMRKSGMRLKQGKQITDRKWAKLTF